MSISMQALGRETPYKIQALPKSDKMLVSYSDGLAIYQRKQGKHFQLSRECSIPNNATAIVTSQNVWQVAVLGDEDLSIVNSELNLVIGSKTGSEEANILILEVNEDHFLSLDENSLVSYWKIDSASGAIKLSQWQVECTPLFPRGNGKTIVCAERGRLQERDPKTGTLLKTWSGQFSADWGISDQDQHHAVTVDESGQASLWELSSREHLFDFDVPFQVVRACFASKGLSGALLGLNGEVSLFKLTEGGRTQALQQATSALVSLDFVADNLIGLDENGGLWELSEETTEYRGGSWAGWATCTCPLDEHRLAVGTATGSIEFFAPDGSHMTRSLQIHKDAVIGLDKWGEDLISIGADASVFRLKLGPDLSVELESLIDLTGRSVVSYCYSSSADKLWLALDEGLLIWLSLGPDLEWGEFQIEGRRVEEIRPSGSEQVIVLTDRGSVKRISLEP